MDVELLAKMIGELVVDHDQVGLPGVGTFFAELVPASFSDKGYTINPPYRRLSFYPNNSEETLLIDFYASSNHMAPEAAKAYIDQFLMELKTVLKEKKTIVLPGLGRLRATRENNFFFVANENLDIFPEGFGLEPVSLKTLQEPDPINISESFAEIVREIAVQAPVSTPVPSPEPVEEPIEEPVEESAEAPVETPLEVQTEVQTEAQTEVKPDTQEVVEETPEAAAVPAEQKEEGKAKKPFRWWVPLLILIALTGVALLAFLVLAEAAPDLIDSILYTPEELRIINY